MVYIDSKEKEHMCMEVGNRRKKKTRDFANASSQEIGESLWKRNWREPDKLFVEVS
jgi:hypothetical protein